MNILRKLLRELNNLFREFVQFSFSMVGGVLGLIIGLILLAIVFVLGPFFVFYALFLGTDALGDFSRSLFGFSSAFLLVLGIPLIWMIYRSKNRAVADYYKRRKEGRSTDSEQGIDSLLFWSQTGGNQIIGFGSILLAFILVTIRLSIDFMPIYFVFNITSWLASSAIYHLQYCPIKLTNPSLGTLEKPSREHNKLKEIQAAIWGIPLAAALSSGFYLYASF